MFELKLAYYAGLFDGEGYVSIANQSPGSANKHRRVGLVLRTGISMCDSVSLRNLSKDFGGGKIYEHERIKETHRILYSWIICSRQAAKFLRSILPYIVVKKEQVELGLTFFRFNQRHPYNRPLSEKEYAINLEFKQRLHALKKISVHGATNAIGANSGNAEIANPELTRRKSLKRVETIDPSQMLLNFINMRHEIVHPNEN